MLATALLDKLANALPGDLMIPGHDGDIQVSFSAGITKENLPDAIAMGVQPATICSDLLKPGGYGRLAPMLRTLTAAVAESSASDLAGWRAQRVDAAMEAGHRAGAAEHLAPVLGDDLGTYALAGNEKLPRAVDHDLEMWGCVACNFCVTVCPNDAFFKLPTQDIADLEGRRQYFVLSELCNECGNCLTFCPGNGDAAMIKPRLYLDRDRFDAAEGPRFFVETNGAVSATPAGGSDAEVPTLVALLNAPEGFPIADSQTGRGSRDS